MKRECRGCPFPLKSDWTQTHWDRLRAVVDRLTPQEFEAALAWLHDVFPPDLADSLWARNHPVASHQYSYVGRLSLLELGHALAIVPPDDYAVRRLRQPDEYEGVAAERRVALLLVRAGAQLEPIGAVGGKRCEYVARLPDGQRLAVEVKLPSMGESERKLELATLHFKAELEKHMLWLQECVPGARVTFHFSREIADLVDHGEVNSEQLRSCVEAVERVRAAMYRNSPPGQIDLGRIGTLDISQGSPNRRVQFDAFEPLRSVRELSRRVTRNLLKDAMTQIGAARLPGVVVLDIYRDVVVGNATDALRNWASQQSSLAALLILDRTVVASDGRMYGSVNVLPGPERRSAMPLFRRAFDTCVAGHCHYNPLCTPSSPCPM